MLCLDYISARFVSDQRIAHNPLEVWTSRSEAQAVINIYAYGVFTEEEDQSHLDDVLHLGQRCTAALKEAQVSGCSCCCGGGTVHKLVKTSGGASSLFDGHKDAPTLTHSLDFQDSFMSTRNFSGGHQ